MAYRVKLNIDSSQVRRISELGVKAPAIAQRIVQDGAELIKQYAVQNLSGVPFTSSTGTHTIDKRSGRGAGSIQVQYPYGSPFKARVFANYQTQYGGNPESYNVLSILEYGRGEVKPRYTPSMKRGQPEKARLAIPVGEHELVFGVKGFRGVTGRYRFVKSLPPMEGKGWMEAAVKSANEELPSVVNDHLTELLRGDFT